MGLSRVLRHVHSHTNSTEGEGDTTAAKTTAMVVLFMGSFILGSLPIKLNQWFHWNSDTKNNIYVKYLLGLGGGVLLCTTLVHLLPEVRESFENLNLTPDFEINYAEFLMCVGFFMIYFVEECVHSYIGHKNHDQESVKMKDGDIEVTVKQNLSLKDSPIDQHEDHSHIPITFDTNSTIAIIRGLLMILALSLHALFEGLAIGLESSPRTVWYMFGAVSAHKMVIAFCVGIELITSGLKTLIVLSYVFTFAVVSPIGMGIGIIVSTADDAENNLVSVILQSLAAGTLLYVVFFEILQGDKKNGIVQFTSVFFGFLIMFGLFLMDQ
ncbi:zinc transporter ZIP1-like isoform X2 [Diorhabda carinulata]|nr:zinc transporter ZIP1-like isoform X2 [Diorhabda carinulata]XP_057657290.1 zinc transporter ZIP1-like isoform X2 [Diorhabda carinulata]